MSAADRPWWASGDDRLDPDEDPLDRHRRARRSGTGSAPDAPDEGVGGRTGAPDPGGPGDRRAGPGETTSEGAPSWWLPAVEAITRFASEATRTHATDDEPAGGPAPAEHRIDACGVCPICIGIRALGDARPELVGHLAEAARHLALAVRTAVDAATDAGEASAADGGTRGERLQHIDLDD